MLNNTDYLEYVQLAFENLDVPELALFINNEMVAHFVKNPLRDLPNHEVEKIYRTIFTKYFDSVWPVLSKQFVQTVGGRKHPYHCFPSEVYVWCYDWRSVRWGDVFCQT